MISEGHLINGGFSLPALMQTIGGANELEGPCERGLRGAEVCDDHSGRRR